MIILRERYTPMDKDIVTVLEPSEWVGRPIIDLIPRDIRDAPITVQVIKNTRDLNDEDLFIQTLDDNDIITVRIVPKLPAIGTYILYLVIGLAVGYAIQAIINAIIGKPKQPKNITDEESPTYAFDVPQNTTKNGTPISVIYGEIKAAGQILQAKTRVLNDGRVAIYLLIGVGEGGDVGFESISGISTDSDGLTGTQIPESVEINSNPASTYRDLKFSTRMGTKNQKLIPGFEDTVVLSVPFDTLLLASPVEFTYTTSNNVDSVEVNLTFPSGLFSLGEEGNLGSHTTVYSITWKRVGDTVNTGTTTETINRATRQSFDTFFRIDNLNLAKYTITVKRLSADDTGSTTLVSDLYVKGFQEIISDDLTYPGIALASIEAIATDQLHGGAPNVNFLVRGIKVRVYIDTNTYSYQWTQNPAWVIFDLFINKRYGLGDKISINDINIQSFIDTAAYCDELVDDGSGGVEKRSQIDIVIDEIRDAWDWVFELLQSSQLTLFTADGKYTIKPDKIADPVMLFTEGNVQEFRWGYTPIKDRHNFIEVAFFDRDIDYRQEYLTEMDPEITDLQNFVKESVEFRGVTRRSQAHRLAVYRINANKLLLRYAKWTSDISAIRCEPADIVEVAHESAVWGLYSGRATGSTLNSVDLDKEVLIESGKTYSIKIFYTNGVLEEKVISATPGVYSTVGISGQFSGVPPARTPWAIGEINIVIKKFRIVDMELTSEYKVNIFAIEYSPDVYSDEIISLPTQPVREGFNPGQVPPDVRNLLVTQRTGVLPDGTLEVIIDVSWNLPFSAIYDHADVWFKKSTDTAWQSHPAMAGVKGGYARLLGNFTTGDTITVAVTAASVFGVRKHPSQAPYVTLTITASTLQPGNVTGFTVSRFQDKLTFHWDAVIATDLLGYEIRQGNDWATGTVLAAGILSTAYETSLFFSFNTPITVRYMIKAKNVSGNYSVLEAAVLFQIDPRRDRNIVLIKDYRNDDWPGTLTNFQKEGSTLPRSIGIINTTLSAVFETAVIDLGGSFQTAIAALLTSTQIDSNLTWASATFTWESLAAQNRTWQGIIGESHITTTLEWRFSDSSDLTPILYTPFIVSEKVFRYSQFRITSISDSPDFDGTVDDFKVTFDVPDITDSGIATVTGSLIISYSANKTFHNSASIIREIIVKDILQGEFFNVDDTNNTDHFRIRIFDSGSAELTVPRIVEWFCKGY